MGTPSDPKTPYPDDSERAADDHLALADESGAGFLTGPGLIEHPVEYGVVDGHAIHEGCIDLGPVDEVEAEADAIRARAEGAADGESLAEGPDIQMGVGLPSDSRFLWTRGVVPYTIASDVPDQGRVDDAIRHIESKTGIRFAQRTSQNASQHPNYIEIISNGNKGWSSSAIGMRGGRQVIRFSDRHSWPILVHEFLHALGVYHEQSRSDRDRFIEVRWDNIPDGPPPEGESNWTGNFQKKPGSVDYGAYDYDSIMHYGPRNFARDRSQPTLVPKRAGVTIGQREGLSYGDRQTLAKMYERFTGRGFSGVWRAGTGRYGLWVNSNWASFRSKWREWSRQGLRLHDIHVHRRGNRTLYSGVFRPGSGRHGLWANVDWNSFRAKWTEWSGQGLRLVDFHVHRAGGENRYTGVFLPGSGAHGLWVNVDWNNFRSKWNEWSQRNLRLVDLHVHRVGGQDRYSGVFLRGSGAHGLWASTSWSRFRNKWREWSAQGLRLVDLNVHQVGRSVRYSGAFLPGRDGHALWANVSFESLRAKWEELAESGLRLVDFEIVNPAAGSAADAGDFVLSDAADLVDAADFDLDPEVEAFGGIFGDGVPLLDAGVDPEDGGGGLGEDSGGAADAERGGLGADDASDGEGLGGADFDTESEPGDEGFGGVVLPTAA
ncbi:MAG: M12 family metallopeptidase [Acidobacteriota bacterium]